MSEGKTCSEFYTWMLEMLLKQISRQKKAEGSFLKNNVLIHPA